MAVYDATTLALLATVDLGADRIGGLALDSAAQRLYVVNSGTPTAATPLYIVNTVTLAQLPSLTVNNAGGAPFNFAEVDPASGRLFLTTSSRLFILNSSGAQLASTLAARRRQAAPLLGSHRQGLRCFPRRHLCHSQQSVRAQCQHRRAGTAARSADRRRPAVGR
ncbi:MAG: hypothetical protein V9H69_20830 [Anaerolineae bacterium]